MRCAQLDCPAWEGQIMHSAIHMQSTAAIMLGSKRALHAQQAEDKQSSSVRRIWRQWQPIWRDAGGEQIEVAAQPDSFARWQPVGDIRRIYQVLSRRRKGPSGQAEAMAYVASNGSLHDAHLAAFR